MSDLTERLRAIDHMSVEDCFLQSPLFAHAADEIDRLNAQLADVAKDRDYWKVEAEGERAKVEFRDKRLAQFETLNALKSFVKALRKKP